MTFIWKKYEFVVMDSYGGTPDHKISREKKFMMLERMMKLGEKIFRYFYIHSGIFFRKFDFFFSSI